MPETSARRNAFDFWYNDSCLIWSDSRGSKYLDQGSLNDFIYELADALKVVVYGKALVDEINEEHKKKKKALGDRIRELSVENSTNLNHCNQHYKDLIRAQTKIANLEYNFKKAQSEANALAIELEEMTASPWRRFKGFLKALWRKAMHRKRRAEDGGE